MIAYDAAVPVFLEGETLWPQVPLIEGSIQQAIGPGETLTVDTGLTSAFLENPDRLSEYVILVDTESGARVYPIIITGQPVRAWLNVSDSVPAL